MEPEISAVIPTYNCRKYVKFAIDSAFAQKDTDIEIIVIDDGSTDDTGDLLQDCYGDRIRYIWQENSGESSARNRGVEAAQGEFVAFLDADDMWLPQKSRVQLDTFRLHPEHCLVVCQAHVIGKDNELLREAMIEQTSAESSIRLPGLLQKNVIAPSCTLMRRDILQRIGGFDPAIKFGEDWDLWLRLGQQGDFAFIAEPLALYRQHSASQSRIPPEGMVGRFLQDRVYLLERAFAAYSESIGDLQPIRKKTLAFQYAQAAAASYAWGEWPSGQAYLAQAINLDPASWQDGEQLKPMIIAYFIAAAERKGSEFSLQHLQDFEIHLQHSLPAQLMLSRHWKAHLLSRLYAEGAYQASLAGDTTDVWQYSWQAFQKNPGLLFNIGMLRRLLRV